jgi:hypothetical protein
MPGPRLDCLDTKTASSSAFFFLLSSFPPDYLDGACFRFETDDVAPAELLSRTTAEQLQFQPLADPFQGILTMALGAA